MRVVVCGAGLAGLGLACALLEAGERREVVLLDPRTGFADDRTWCWWAARRGRFDAAAGARWRSWEVIGADGRRAAHTQAAIPYVHARGGDVYALALRRLEAAGGQVVLRLGTRVEAIDVAGRAAVLTDGERVTGDWVVDARGVAGGDAPLLQAFTGVEVRTERPVFDPEVATLMDFRGAGRPPEGGLRFRYVLAFAPDRALVEDTTFAPGRGPGAADRRAQLQTWLDRRGAGAVAVLREEHGVLPMAVGARSGVLGERVVAIGTGAGAVRPSSGYAFTRVQAHATALAAAIVAGGPPPAPPGSSWRQRQLDGLFLRAVQADPERAARRFARLVSGTGASAFARFMADASSPADEAALMRAAADPALLRALPGHLRGGLRG